LNFKMFVIRHWKLIILAVSIGLLVLSIVMKPLGEPVDSPVGP
jgi:hypothetical protein